MQDVLSSLSTFGSTSSSLLRRVRSGERDAWSTFARLYTPLVFHWVLQDGLSPDDAPDVVQEVFRAVSTHVASLDLARADGSFRGWLRTVTRNKVRDHFRARQRQPDAAGGTEAWQRLQDLPAELEESSDAQVNDARALNNKAQIVDNADISVTLFVNGTKV